MKKFIAIYYAPREKLDEWMNASKAEQEAGMDGWKTWGDTHKKAIVDMGAPLGRNKRVMGSGVTDMRNEACGYTIVEADTHAAAAKIFADNPHVKEKTAWVDVLEIMPMENM
jgi:hypothetical protein